MLEQGDGGWKVTTPADFTELDPNKAARLVASFAPLPPLPIAAPPPSAAESGFARPTGTITLTRKDGGTVTVTIGGKNEKGDKNYFVKVTGRSEVFSVNEFVVGNLLKSAPDLKKTPGPPPGAGMPPGMGAMPPGHGIPGRR